MLVFLLSFLFLFSLIFVLFQKNGVSHPLSRLMLLSLIFCSLATTCLGINYTLSLLPDQQDGIAVSNYLSYFIIGEDHWSHEKFQYYFDGFLTASFVLMALYVLVLTLEARQN